MRRLPRLSLPRVVLLLAALVVGYLLFSVASDVLLSHRLDRDEQRLQQEIVELRRHQRELEAIREYLRTDEYVEGVARRVLGLVGPGEMLVVVSSSAPTATPESSASERGDRPWWEALYGP